MSYITINFPVLVQQVEADGKPAYSLRPLFQSYPSTRHRRFERALNQLQKEIRRYFKGFTVDRDNIDELLWFMFNPRIKFNTFTMSFVAGKNYVSGQFTVVYFVLKDKCFVFLPAFDNHFFIATPDKKGKYAIRKEAETVIQAILRKEKKEYGEKVDIHEKMATKGEFVTNLKFSLKINHAKFPFESSALDSFFASLSGNFAFDGSVEIEKVGYNLNDLYPSELGRAYYREELVERVSSIIYQAENTPVIIVGPEGVGKRSIMQEAVFRYRERNSDTKYKNLEKVWLIDPTRVIAGMSIVGMWQKRFEAILKHVRERRKGADGKTDKIIIDNVVAMLRIGKSAQNDMTLSDVLKPYLEKRQIQVVLIATPQEWKILQEKDRRFSDLFQVIRVEEPDVKTAVQMVVEQRKLLELEHDCQISTMGIVQLFNIHRNYLKRSALPGSVMKILRQLAVKYKGELVDAYQVKAEFEDFSGLNKEIFDETYKFEKDEVRQRISKKLIGQPQAVGCLADTIHLIKSKLNDPEKPLGSFLFIGPTGVGKTQAAKVLCNYLMGDEDHLLRFDMNEYIDEYSIQRLIGDYYNPEGQLTGRVRYQPFGIILFDEIEKAHPKVHDLLLQVLDDGRLTDSLGRTVDFSNTTIIMTSNVGARDASMRLGFRQNAEDEGAIYRKAVEKRFRPEFVNRIDRIVIFNPLGFEHILNIAKLQINELLSRDGFVRRTTILNISDDALEWVAKRGFDAKMGGRALKRQIERDLTSLSADQLIKTFSDRPIIFDITLKDDQLHPAITPLDFVQSLGLDWIPTIPNEKSGRKFYSRMLREVESLERKISGKGNDLSTSSEMVIKTDESGNLDWQYFWFKDQLSEFKENIRRKILGFGHQVLEEAPVIALRLKRAKTSSTIQKNLSSGSKLDRHIIKDKLFQQEGLEEIRDMYRYGQAQFDKMQSQYLSDILDFNFLNLFSRGFLEQKSQKIEIHFESCITNLGDKQIKFLMDLYASILSDIEIQHSRHNGLKMISGEGHSLFDFLSGEGGIHLFHLPHQNPLPIKVRIVEVGKEDEVEDLLKVIRVYDGDTTLTDIRTGFTNAANITTNEFKLLIFGGLKAVQPGLLVSH
ncbi:MAG: AAA family ATPase [Bacteroidota bacterium]